MVESLIHMDKAVFRFFNTTIANPFFDWIMPIITNQNIWAVPIIIIIFSLLFKGGRRGRIAVAIIIISVGLADAASAQILKPFFARLRPSHELTEGIRILMGKEVNMDLYPPMQPMCLPQQLYSDIFIHDINQHILLLQHWSPSAGFMWGYIIPLISYLADYWAMVWPGLY